MAENGGPPELAERLDVLFRTVVPPGGHGRWSNEQASAELTRQGTPTSAAYLSQLRHGKRVNPSARILGALAELFRVPVGYFFDQATAERIDENLPLLSALQDPEVVAVALRARGLSPGGLACVRGIIEHFRTIERLPNEGDPADPAGPDRSFRPE